MQYLLILGLCVLSSVVYGIAHDQVTARICVEYFTIGHEPLWDTTSPTLLGLGWGIVATWWVGFILGVPLALVARVGPWPKRDVASLMRPIAILMAICGTCAAIGGVAAHWLAVTNRLWLLEPLASRVPAERHVAFLTDLGAHVTSYAVGFLGGLVVIAVVLVERSVAARRERMRGQAVEKTDF